jgi:hypothetical protein
MGREKGEWGRGKLSLPLFGESVLPFTLPSSPLTIKCILVISGIRIFRWVEGVDVLKFPSINFGYQGG